MNATLEERIDDEIEWADAMLKCAESWAKGYDKDSASHARLMLDEARLERKIRKCFREIANNIGKYVNRENYTSQIKADLQVDVIVKENLYDDLETSFIKITFDTLNDATTAGAVAGETIYNIPLGITSTDAAIMALTTDQLARLVGKQVILHPSGGIADVVDNPSATYRLSDQTRKDIATSIKTSISLGEDIDSATKRLQDVIYNKTRAATIARTETVNAYTNGHLEFGRQSGATGKEWESVGAVDICAQYSELGVVNFNYVYDDSIGLTGPAAHPNCRCYLRLAYANEYPVASSL